MSNLILNRVKLQKFRQISDAINDNKLNQIIMETQIQDLKPLLGRDFYYKLVANPTTDDHKDILEPKSGTIGSTQFDHVGLEEVLSYFVFGRLILFGDIINTPFGFTTKLSSKDSKPIEYAMKKATNKEMKDIGFNLWLEVRNFMVLNKTPGFDDCKTKPTRVGGLRITKII